MSNKNIINGITKEAGMYGNIKGVLGKYLKDGGVSVSDDLMREIKKLNSNVEKMQAAAKNKTKPATLLLGGAAIGGGVTGGSILAKKYFQKMNNSKSIFDKQDSNNKE